MAGKRLDFYTPSNFAHQLVEKQTVMKVKEDVEGRIGPKPSFNAINFRAANTEIQYIAKVHVGGNDCVHVKISQTLPCYGEKVQVVDLRFPKTRDEEIEPF